MNEKHILRQLRSRFSAVGAALLIYYGIMNVMVTLVSIIQGVLFYIGHIDTAPDALLSDEMLDLMLDEQLSCGWGYILAAVIGAIVLLLWKKKQFFFKEIWKTEKPMRAGSFFLLLILVFSTQALVQLMATGLEWVLNYFGKSASEAFEAMTVSGSTFSMFLYMGLVAPVFEEILFRGVILKTLEPFGRKFAVFASAFLFGIFHGNILQTPFAFVVGLILGYIALEYSIVWAMVLHMINNLILGDSLLRITRLLPPWAGEVIFAVVIWGSLVAAAIILLVKRKQMKAYFSGPKIHPLCMKAFFTSPGILILSVIMVLNILLGLLFMFL